jgi:hypothetical protein
MKASVAALLAIGLALVAIPASAQRRGNQPRPPAATQPIARPPIAPAPPTTRTTPTPTASEMYWGAVRAASGPIGFPQATSGDQFTRNSRRRGQGSGPVFFPSVSYAEPPEPVYVPVYVPGPVVYVPVPAAAPPPAPADNRASVAPAARRPEKFYVITGCYAGNRPPEPKALPAGCDINKLRVNTW